MILFYNIKNIFIKMMSLINRNFIFLKKRDTEDLKQNQYKHNYFKELINEKEYNKFIFFFIAIVAKLTSIDGETNKQEITEFFKNISVDVSMIKEVNELFHSALQDQADSIVFAKRLLMQWPNNNPLYEKIIISLISIAHSDGYINNKEMSFLKTISEIFSINNEQLIIILRKHLIKPSHNPYELLNLPNSASYAQLSQSYRSFVRLYHPDIFLSYTTISPEYIEIMKDKFNITINAYKKIKNRSRFFGIF